MSLCSIFTISISFFKAMSSLTARTPQRLDNGILLLDKIFACVTYLREPLYLF